MKIKTLKITKLFDLFDYDIPLQNNENLLIVTGPNGYGKTMLLNIIHSLFNRKFLFFQKLVFEKITILLEDDISVIISKSKLIQRDLFYSDQDEFDQNGIDNEKQDILFTFIKNDSQIDEFIYSIKLNKEFDRIISNFLPVRRINENSWEDRKTGRMLSLDDIINEYIDNLPEEITKKILKPSTIVSSILDSIQVHLIKEQRLLKVQNSKSRNYREEETTYTETIHIYAQELRQLIREISQTYFKTSQELDSSFPKRLLNETAMVSVEDFNKRFDILREKQEKLKKYGLSESEQEVPQYDEKNANVLLVYLKDSERKISVFDNLLDKLELFTGILNERRFTFKTIQIDREKGFFFKTSQGKELSLSDLSSGEQHEVVLLYELIFNAKPNTIVLIDEPEISLHITWQKGFLNDLLRIVELQKIQVLIATHSPSIINDRWDLVYNLEKAEIK